MKKLKRIDIDTMISELQVLDKQEKKTILGGFSNNSWSCVFNCMEYIGRLHGLDHSDTYYSNLYKEMTGHDPSGSNGMYTNQIGSLLAQAGFGYTQLSRINNDQVNGNQFIIMPGANGRDHAVILKSISGSIANYHDPTTGLTGSVSGSLILEIYDTSPFIDYDTPGSNFNPLDTNPGSLSSYA